jgi:hypothetical protein
MPLAIVDGGTKIRRMILVRTEIAASFRAATSADHAARRSEPAVGTAATKTAAMVFTASARRPRAAMRSAATMEATAATTTMGTTAAAVTAAAVLSECWNGRESKTGESGKYKEGSKKTKSAHNPYLPSRRECSFERGAYVQGAYVQGRRAPT